MYVMCYVDLLTIHRAFFSEPRQSSGSHTVFKIPCQGSTRINIQKSGNQAKIYQVDKLSATKTTENYI